MAKSTTYKRFTLTRFVCEDTCRIYWDWKLQEFTKSKKKRGRRRRLVSSTFPKDV